MQNIENSDIRLDEIITITQKVMILGSDNAYRWFTPYKQYVFCDQAIMPLNCNFCVDNPIGLEKTNHYKVCLDSVEYWIPDYAAVIEGKLRYDWEQDHDLYQIHRFNQPLDVKKEYFDITGRILNPGEVEHNGYEIWKKHIHSEPRLLDESNQDNR